MWRRQAMKKLFKEVSKNDLMLYAPFAAIVLLYAAIMAWLYFTC